MLRLVKKKNEFKQINKNPRVLIIGEYKIGEREINITIGLYIMI